MRDQAPIVVGRRRPDSHAERARSQRCV